jgi:hypothetical protein
LEGVLQATVQYLQARLEPAGVGEIDAGRYSTLTANVLTANPPLKSWYRRTLVPVAAAVAGIRRNLYRGTRIIGGVEATVTSCSVTRALAVNVKEVVHLPNDWYLEAELRVSLSPSTV